MSLQRSRTARPRSALSSNSARSRETYRPACWVWIFGKRLIQNRQNGLCNNVALEPQKNRQPWKRLGASRTQPRRGGRLSKPSSPASLWPVVRGENSSRQKLANSQGRPGGNRRADCRSFEPRRFGRRDRGATGLDGEIGVARKWRRNGLKTENRRVRGIGRRQVVVAGDARARS
jgi:hypothetical protein